MELILHSKSVYNLETDKFSKMLDDPTQCYKFYWLEAIITLLFESDDDVTFDEIINEMIWQAWHTVTLYHLKLGPTIKGKSNNFLEQAVKLVAADDDLKQPVYKENILQILQKENKEILFCKNHLIDYVPYKLLTPFYDDVASEMNRRDQKTRLIKYLQILNTKTKPLFYTIILGKGLAKRIHVDEAWKLLIKENYSVIISWIHMNKVKFLQDRNPGVPGIVYKIAAEQDNKRKMKNARELWKKTTEISGMPLRDIYSGDELSISKFDLDHFVPWSFVANDELWNLTPMDHDLNIKKSNDLPGWETYFGSMAINQYRLYSNIFKYESLRSLFEKCRKDNLNAIWAAEKLYIEGNSEEQFINILEHNMKPIYEAALIQGYGTWINSK